MAQRDTKGMVEWYRTHRTTTQIGFNPNGMCLKVCRTARNIPSLYQSALAAQVATPKEDRIYDPSKFQVGLIAFFDDPRDDNPYGHIASIVGKKVDKPNSLDDWVFDSNSIESGRLTRVAGDYFTKHWGDKLQFAATSLNKVDLLLPSPVKPTTPKKDHLPVTAEARLRAMVKEYDRMIARTTQRRLKAALQRDRAYILKTIKDFG